MTTITEFAPAKINLSLEILGRREDGYHEVRSLVAFSRDCGDRLEYDPDGPPGLTVTGPFGGAIFGENLIARAVGAVARAAPGLRTGSFVLTKNLPVASGVGGGSANAAAAVRLLRRANPDLETEAINWTALAAKLGADVPVCLRDAPVLMTGIGEIMSEPVPLPALHAVLVNPLIEVPVDKTARVFKALAAPPLAHLQALPPPRFASSADVAAYMGVHGNDLTAPSRGLFPAICVVLDALAEQKGCLIARLSGAGPTCFALFETAADSDIAADELKRGHPTWWVAASRLA